MTTEGKKFFFFFCFLLAVLCPGGMCLEERKSNAEESLAKRQRAELLGFYLKDPKDAKLPQTPLSIELYNQAVEHFKRRDYDLSREALQDSLRYDPRNSFAYELLGDIDYSEGHLTEAIEHYKAAFLIQSREELKEKLEKVIREKPVEEQLSTYSDKRFILKYQGKEYPEELTKLRELLHKTYNKISKDFGYYFKQPVVVLVYDEEKFQEITRLPHWVGGLYDGQIRVPISRTFFKKDLRTIAAHEMTHAFVAGMSQGQAPAWINEGLAVYEENKIKKKDLIVFKAAIKTHTLFPLDQLMNEQKIDTERDPLLVTLFYEESFHLVHYLVKRFGIISVKQLLEEFAKGKNSDEALRIVLGMPVNQLEQEWKTSFIKQLR